MQSMGTLQIPEQFSSVMGLGAPVRVFAPKGSSRWGSVIFGLLLLGGSAVVVLGGAYYAYDQMQKHGPAVFQLFQREIGLPLIFVGLMFIFGVALVFSAFNNWTKAAVLYEKGLAYNDRKGVQMWRWEEVAYFFIAITKHYTNGVYTGTTYIYTLQKADGSRLVLNNALGKVQELGDVINKNIFPLQYQRLVDQLKQGQAVVLGPITLSKDSITVDKKSYAWAEVEQVGIQRGFVSVKKKNGGWFSGASTRVAVIPNLDAMLSVVDQIVKVKAG